jgi:threonine aldolase
VRGGARIAQHWKQSGALRRGFYRAPDLDWIGETLRAIDLRSDTFTLPSHKMLETILGADLGDDVEREDPTVNKLQETAAAMFGAEDALLVSSGTMGNLVAMLTHCRRGDEIILESEAHMYYYEVGGMSALVGAIPHLIKGENGVFTPGQVQRSLRPGDPLHYPPSRLLEIENTHNRAGGCCWKPSQVQDVSRVAHENGMSVHIDGARIFNACVALDVGPREYMRHVDSLTFCLSKGLSCPIGSILVGSKEFIEKARVNRKMVGGGMRQAGVIAAPGIYALENMVTRLKEDHDNATYLAKGLAEMGLTIDMRTVQTNIVLGDTTDLGMSEDRMVDLGRSKGVLFFSMGPNKVRLVTHFGITSDDIDETLTRLETVLGGHR